MMKLTKGQILAMHKEIASACFRFGMAERK